ncbi:hypothetical protein GGR77_003795 [Xanthomonas translucens]
MNLGTGKSRNDSAAIEFNFEKFCPEGQGDEICFEIGEIIYGLDGELSIKLYNRESKLKSSLFFSSPLAIRIANEGSLMEYWNNGLIVGKHNLLVATTSPFLKWLEKSSSGVHSEGAVKHYAIFSDDVCLEVLSSEQPVLLNP